MDISQFRVEILKQEIDTLSQHFMHIATHRWRCRQMAIVLWTAAVGFGLKENMGLLCALGALVPSPFWIIDAWYRQRERALMLRFKAIRDVLRDGRYMVKGENEATLQQFLDAEETSLFPVPDHWGSKTIPPKTLEVFCGLRHNLWMKILVVYIPMFFVGVGLAVFLWMHGAPR